MRSLEQSLSARRRPRTVSWTGRAVRLVTSALRLIALAGASPREHGRPQAQIARELGVAGEALRSWVRQAEVDAGERERRSSEEREGLRRLRRENRLLQEEREI